MVSRVPGLNKVMRSLNLQHTYRSSYTVGSYATNLNYLATTDGFSYIKDLADNFVPAYDFNSVITSYSIHYTKLYEFSCEPNRKASIGFIPEIQFPWVSSPLPCKSF